MYLYLWCDKSKTTKYYDEKSERFLEKMVRKNE